MDPSNVLGGKTRDSWFTFIFVHLIWILIMSQAQIVGGLINFNHTNTSTN
jgi:hypothetical protein